MKEISDKYKSVHVVGGRFPAWTPHSSSGVVFAGCLFICGGSIIIVEVILTAAHCTEDEDLVKLRMHDQNDHSAVEIIVILDKVNHPSRGIRGKIMTF
jgi:hypothetical protein